MEHGPSFPFRRKEAKENQIGGCTILTLPRGHGCIMKHEPAFPFRRKEAKENQIGGCAILTLPRGTRLHRETRVFFSSLSSAGMPRRGMPSSAANPPRPIVSFVSFLQEKKTFPFSLEEPAVGPQGKAGAYPGPSAVRLRARRAPRAAASCSLRGRAARQSRSRRQGSRSCLRAQCAQARASCRS